MSAKTSPVVVSVVITKVAKTKSGESYAAVDAKNGGNFCIFAKKVDGNFSEKQNKAAQKIISGLTVDARVQLNNVGLSNGAILVYDDTTVS